MSYRARSRGRARSGAGSRVRRPRRRSSARRSKGKHSVFVVATIFGVIARRARRSWVGYGEEPAGQCNVVAPVGIGEEAVVTDAMKSVGQDMDQEAADELVGVERHKLIASVALGPVI